MVFAAVVLQGLVDEDAVVIGVQPAQGKRQLTTELERFDAQEKAMARALMAAEPAVLKAEAASEKRFESVNEFRGVLTAQSAL